MERSTFLNPGESLRAAGVHEGMWVADFGAGSGFFTRAAAREVGPKGSVFAVDVNPDLLPRIKNLSLAEGLHNVEVVRGDVERVCGSNLPPERFDFCICANLLFSAEDKRGVAEEIRRVLKRSSPQLGAAGRALVIDWKDSFGGLGPHPDHVFTAAEARKLFLDSGFMLVGDVPAGEYHWGFVVRKTVAKDAQ